MLFYLVAYLFMNLGAFAVVAFLRNLTGSEDLADLPRPGPPLAGAGRHAWRSSCSACWACRRWSASPPSSRSSRVLFDAGPGLQRRRARPGWATRMYALLVVGGLNTVISVVYYIKVLKVMILERPVEEVEGEDAGAAAGVSWRCDLRHAPVRHDFRHRPQFAWNPLAEASDWGARLNKPAALGGRPAVAVHHEEGRP